MCGIAGFNWENKQVVKKMTDSIKHRGPDAEGFYLNDSISLGHRRLSIMDLTEKGKQPMVYKDYVIIFNGEIYNFKEIKKTLEQKGDKFKSETDTEVILHAYERWGKECVKKFNGMWAFCIYNKRKNKLFISRDRYGIKPLYYYWDKDKFIFASELKAIRRHKLDLNICKEGLNWFFYQKYIGGELTIFRDCFKLESGHSLFFDLSKKELKTEKYYDLNKETSKKKKEPLKKRLEEIKNVLDDAVEKRLISDVPVGGFLSGGVDSSLISAIISRNRNDFNTFSIGFKEKSYNELSYSSRVSKLIKTKHSYDSLDIDDGMIEFVVSSMDEPFGDPSIIPTFLLSKKTKEKVTVALSGDGADEIFGGYDSYKGYYIAKFIPIFFVNIVKVVVNYLPADDKKLSFSFKIKRFVRDYEKNIIKRHLNWMATFNDEKRKKLLNSNFRSELMNLNYPQNLKGIQMSDINYYMCEGILKKVELASMLNSLEVRVPFLDYRLVPTVLSLPEKFKVHFFETKWLLKKIALKYLPKSIVYRKKRGFSVPIAKWFKKSDLLKKYILKDQYYKHNLLNKKYVEKLYKDHISKKKDNSRELWVVFVLNCWYWHNEDSHFIVN